MKRPPFSTESLRTAASLLTSPAFVKKAARTLAVSAAAITLLVSFILPYALRPFLERKLSEAVHRTVSIRKLSLNPFMLSAALKGVTIGNRDAPGVMLSFDELYVNVQVLSAIRRGLIVSRVRLVKPYLNIARNRDLAYSFSDLLVTGPPPPPEEGPREPFKFSINNIEVKDGSADFHDAPRNTRHTVRNLNVSIPFLSNLPYDLTSYVEPFFEATVNGTAIVFRGKTLPFNESLETTVDVDLKDIDLAHYLAYSPVPLQFRVLSGKMDAQAAVSFRQFKDRPPTVSLKGTVAFKDIRLADRRSGPLVEWSLFSLSFLPSDLMSKVVHFSDISLIAPKVYVERAGNGELGIVKAFVPGTGAAGKEREAVPAEAAQADAAPLPVIDIDTLSIRDGMLRFTDRQPAAAPEEGDGAGRTPAKLLADRITLKAGSLSTQKDKKGTIELSLNINGKGALRTAGTLGLNPLDLETSVDLGNVMLAPFQPYASQKADVLLAGGRLFANGTARVRDAGVKGVSAAYSGSASLDRLAVRDALNNEDLLAWRSLRFDGIDAGYNPLSVKIRRIALTGLSARIIVHEDGVLNFQQIVKKGPAPEEGSPEAGGEGAPSPAAGPAGAGPEPPPDISIGKVTLTGSLAFIDRHVKPMYTANLLGIEGTVSGLSSKEDRTADLLLKGAFDRYAPLLITGKINPLRKDLFVDIKADFKDMELSPLTPYSGTYIGNAIQKGKLSFGLRYHIEERKLDAKNDVFIDQLTLGEKIESPSATSLPVGLAISLLKNRKGEIRLDIPVTGAIDDPEFGIWGTVLRVLVNLLTKAATSPFALLGSLMGGEDLGYVEFDHGASGLTEQNAKKLDALAEALYDRPALKLEITGHADPESDSEGLRARRMKDLIVSQKIRDLPKKDGQPVPLEAAQVSPAEYPVYLKKAYKSGRFSKPRNIIGIARDLPDAEMEKLLLASIRIQDDDLRQLASARAQTVKDAILRSGKIEPERVFLLEPKALLPEQKEKLRNSRVDFSLK